MLKNPEITALLNDFEAKAGHEDRLVARDGEPRLKVGSVASKAALFYERVRYAVDNKDEHLLRRHAIERMLRRMIMFDYHGKDIASTLLVEMIRSGYMANDEFPERIVEDIGKIIKKTFVFSDMVASAHIGHKSMGRFKKRMLQILSGEIENYLFPQTREEAMVKYFYHHIKSRVVIEESVPERTKEVQLYLTAWKALFQTDPSVVFYRLWIAAHPNWITDISPEELSRLAHGFAAEEAALEAQITLELGDQLLSHTRNDAIVTRVLFGELTRCTSHAERVALLENAAELARTTELSMDVKYRSEQKRVSQSAFQAITYIFTTKTVLAVGLEVPYDLFVVKHINIVPLLINVLFHPLLLFGITQNVHIPKRSNTKRLVEMLQGIVSGSRTEKIYIPKVRTNPLREIAFGLYGAVLITIVIVLINILLALKFNILGIGFFMLFLALVSYFGFRIRYFAKQWVLSGGEDKAGNFFIDMLTLPIVLLGRYMIRHFDYVNVMVFILDFIIETPYQLALDVVDSFSSLLKEKKEQMYT